MEDATNTPEQTLQIIYDGECPFCSRYVQLIRLQSAVGHVELISARDDHVVVKALLKQGYDLDKGMVVSYKNSIYFGEDAVHFLSVLSTRSGLFNRLMKAVFSHKSVARFCYPFLRFGRNAALFFKGTPQIKSRNP